MAKQGLILFLIVCLTLAVFAGRTLSQQRIPLTGPDPRSVRGLTESEKDEAIKKWFADRRLQNRKLAHEHIARMVREAWKNELRIGEEQWRIIGPKCQRQELVSWEAWARASHGIRSHRYFYWRKATEDRGGGWAPPKAAAELTEAERLVSELIDLVRQEDPNDQELREKMDALQKVREKARKELPKAKRELAAVLTTPRQEAVFLLMGRID